MSYSKISIADIIWYEYDFGDGGLYHPCIVMEYANVGDLHEMIIIPMTHTPSDEDNIEFDITVPSDVMKSLKEYLDEHSKKTQYVKPHMMNQVTWRGAAFPDRTMPEWLGNYSGRIRGKFLKQVFKEYNVHKPKDTGTRIRIVEKSAKS